MVQACQGGKPSLTADLDYGKSSSSDYFPYTGPLLLLDDLLQRLEDVGCDASVQHYFNQETEKCEHAFPPPQC